MMFKMQKALIDLGKKSLIELQKQVLGGKPNRRPRILVYHSISNGSWQLSVSPKRFESHLKYLDENFEVIRLEDLVEGIVNDRDMSGKVSITFDDGHKDNIVSAFPILEKYDMKATFYITVDYIEDKIMDKFSIKNPKSMSWNDVIKLEKHGHEIGSHTITHRTLMSLKNSELKKEIIDSKKIIESKLGGEIKSFAYPAGRFDTRAKKIAKEKYRYCCSVIGGHEDISKQPVDLFDLRRSPVNDITLSEFINVVNGFYDLVYLTSDLFFTKEKSAAEKKSN